jgi:hypothetical protein
MLVYTDYLYLIISTKGVYSNGLIQFQTSILFELE